jgi:hypothetical protein
MTFFERFHQKIKTKNGSPKLFFVWGFQANPIKNYSK